MRRPKFLQFQSERHRDPNNTQHTKHIQLRRGQLTAAQAAGERSGRSRADSRGCQGVALASCREPCRSDPDGRQRALASGQTLADNWPGAANECERVPWQPKLGRANNLQNNTQNTYSVRGGTPRGTPSRTDRITFHDLAIAIARLTFQEESAGDVFWCARIRRCISFPFHSYDNA
jgi:hypothetical protein